MRRWQTIGFIVVVLWTLQPGVARGAEEPLIRKTWTHLDRTQNQCPDLFDYFPDGGIRIFYCHVKTFLNLSVLSRMAGMPVFQSGPHSGDRLNLDARFSFGRYNPEFVRWLAENAIPAAGDAAFRKRTQPLYDRFAAPLARTCFVVHEALAADPGYLAREKAAYMEGMVEGSLTPLFYERYWDFKGLHESGYDGNVVKSVVAFWIRREIDATRPLFFQGLTKLLETYDADFVAANRRGAAPQPSEGEGATEDKTPCERLETADAELNRVYQEIRRAYAREDRFLEALKKAQRAWITFRDDHLAARFPAENPAMAYGTIFHTCACLELAKLTEERTRHLQRWLDGVAEGDGCAGSIRIRR